MRQISLRTLRSHLVALAMASAPGACAPDTCPIGSVDESTEVTADEAHATLGRHLAISLGDMRPLDATHLATTWALSDDPLQRGAIAHALEWAFPLFGDRPILEHLSYDPDPAVRAAVARAAWVRRRTAGDGGILARLSHDPDPEVQAIASRAMV